MSESIPILPAYLKKSPEQHMGEIALLKPHTPYERQRELSDYIAQYHHQFGGQVENIWNWIRSDNET